MSVWILPSCQLIGRDFSRRLPRDSAIIRKDRAFREYGSRFSAEVILSFIVSKLNEKIFLAKLVVGRL
jgi:hypothetical protein